MTDNDEKLDKLISKCVKLALADASGYNECVGCGKRLYWTQMQCGYYHSPLHPGVRFDMKNRYVHCPDCTVGGEDRYDIHRSKIAEIFGQERLEYLEHKLQNTREWTDEEVNAEIRKCNLYLTYHDIP